MTMSAANIAALEATHSRRIYFIYLNLAVDPFYGCTGTRTYTWTSGITSPEPAWLGLGDIGGIGDIMTGADVAARPIEITLSGVDAYITTPALNRVNYKNREASIWRGLLDENEDLIDTPHKVWTGTMDVASVIHDESGSVARMTCEPAAAKLLRPNVSRYANEDHQQRWPGDEFFEYLAQMEKKDVLWGGVRVIPGVGGGGIFSGQPGLGISTNKN